MAAKGSNLTVQNTSAVSPDQLSTGARGLGLALSEAFRGVRRRAPFCFWLGAARNASTAAELFPTTRRSAAITASRSCRPTCRQE